MQLSCNDFDKRMAQEVEHVNGRSAACLHLFLPNTVSESSCKQELVRGQSLACGMISLTVCKTTNSKVTRPRKFCRAEK